MACIYYMTDDHHQPHIASERCAMSRACTCTHRRQSVVGCTACSARPSRPARRSAPRPFATGALPPHISPLRPYARPHASVDRPLLWTWLAWQANWSPVAVSPSSRAIYLDLNSSTAFLDSILAFSSICARGHAKLAPFECLHVTRSNRARAWQLGLVRPRVCWFQAFLKRIFAAATPFLAKRPFFLEFSPQRPLF